MTDRTVVTAVLLALTFTVGVELGAYQTRQNIATNCQPQPGEALISTVQHERHVLCNYGQGYGRAKKTRRAT